MLRSATPLRAIFQPVCVRMPFKIVTTHHAAGARRFIHDLRTVGSIASIPVEPASIPPLVKRFSAWMRQHRGLTEGTLTTSLPLVQEFLAALGDDAAGDDASRVRSFIFARTRRHRHARAKSVVNAVRMFLRLPGRIRVLFTGPHRRGSRHRRVETFLVAALPRCRPSSSGSSRRVTRGGRRRRARPRRRPAACPAGFARRRRARFSLGGHRLVTRSSARRRERSLRDLAPVPPGCRRRHVALSCAFSSEHG